MGIYFIALSRKMILQGTDGAMIKVLFDAKAL